MNERCRRRSCRDAANCTYEPDGDLSVVTQTLNATTLSLNYTHNYSHQLTNITANDSTYLPSPATASTTAYVPNALNQYASVGGQNSSYDTNGNLLTWFPPSGKQTYTFDSENRLVTAAVSGSGTATISYDYDGLGRRVKKTVGGVVTQYLLDGDEEIAELDGSGVVLRRYITGPTIDDRVARAEGSAISNPTKFYYHTNHQGSVLATTNTIGTPQQQITYDEYGNSPSAATGEPFRYTGRRLDPETGLYYYRARYYSPQIGRFMQTDPVGYKDDLDLYTYVGNDPLNSADPTGEDAELYWTAPDQAKLTIRYTVVKQGASPPFTRQQVQSAVAKNLSGTVQVNGKTVMVTAQAIPTSPANANGKSLNTITVVPDTNGVTQSGRAETNKVGGNSVTVGAAQDTATTVSHELGHTAGAGDQYAGGVDVGGNRLPTDVPGPNNIMKDLSGAPANSQSLGEMLRAPTNTNTCAKGVSAVTGGC